MPIRPASPASDTSGGSAATRKTTTPRNTIAPTVRPSAFPRLATKLFGWSRSNATWIPVTSAAIPPEALQSAITTATTSVTDTAAGLASTIASSWNTRKLCTSLGSADATSSTCRFTSAGSAIRPYTEMNAISAGMKARKA